MAIAKIDKIEIIGLGEEKEKFLNLLQDLGKMELIALADKPYEAALKAADDSEILEIEEALGYLVQFRERAGFLEGIAPMKSDIYEKELDEIVATFDHRHFLKILADLRHHLKNLLQHKEKLDEEKRALLPWRDLDIPLDEIRATREAEVSLGVFYTRDYSKISEDLGKEKIGIFHKIVSGNRTSMYVVFIYLKEDLERLQAVLKKYYFDFVTLTHHKYPARERIFGINSEAMIFEDDIENTRKKIASLLEDRFKLMAVYDYLVNAGKRRDAEGNLARQKFTFSMKGWIRHKDLPVMEKALGAEFDDLAIFVSEPKPDDRIPVYLENNRFLEPFEFITKIYGFPKYGEIDPTPYLAPFFFLYFGFCISDAGYGFVLALFSYFVLRKFRMGPQGSRFFRLFLYCGVSTIIIGALTGSWFGNILDLAAESSNIFLPLKKFKDSLIILDPIKEPTKLLAIALSFGIVQVWFGNIVAVIGNMKNRRYLDILLDQAPTLLFLFGLTGLGLIFLKLMGPGKAGIFKYSAILAAAALSLTQGRSEKGAGAKLFFGVYNLYNAVSGYLSDVLSYSRLWALGLVTGVMASTINMISIQFSQIFVSIIPFIGKVALLKALISGLILIAIFVAGHLISFLMNLLGAFVHPVRLQFVEFFSKFFKPGGSAFKPFKVETKYINIR